VELRNGGGDGVELVFERWSAANRGRVELVFERWSAAEHSVNMGHFIPRHPLLAASRVVAAGCAVSCSSCPKNSQP
jgi:hypothetical protein